MISIGPIFSNFQFVIVFLCEWPVMIHSSLHKSLSHRVASGFLSNPQVMMIDEAHVARLSALTSRFASRSGERPVFRVEEEP